MSSARILQRALLLSSTRVTRSLVSRPFTLYRPFVLNTCAIPSLLVSNNKRFLNTKVTENDIFKVVDFNDIQELIKKEGKGYELIDVREIQEVNQGAIPTAKNVPLSQFANVWTLSDTEFKSQFGFEKPKKQDLVVLYCLGGVRSTRAAEYLYSLGYDNLENYTGSWADYVEQIKKQA